MFVQQKQLSVLNVPSSRVSMLYRSGTDIQLALPEMPSQMASAFMMLLRGGGKVQVLVALHLTKSAVNLFYVSDSGEVAAELADRELEAGLDFAESMGFVLNDVEFNRKTGPEKEAYWKSMPICTKHSPLPVETPAQKKPVQTEPAKVSSGLDPSKRIKTEQPETETETLEDEITAALDAKAEAAKLDPEAKRQRLRGHVGRFLASL